MRPLMHTQATPYTTDLVFALVSRPTSRGLLEGRMRACLVPREIGGDRVDLRARGGRVDDGSVQLPLLLLHTRLQSILNYDWPCALVGHRNTVIDPCLRLLGRAGGDVGSGVRN